VAIGSRDAQEGGESGHHRSRGFDIQLVLAMVGWVNDYTVRRVTHVMQHCRIRGNAPKEIPSNGELSSPDYAYCSAYGRCYATTARQANKQRPFLGNGSVNTFPLQRTLMQQ
jgi:hypothetical protein